MDLTPASPYAGKFAGYRIAEGKLNLDLAYQLVGKKLESKNVITLDQFTFGEQGEQSGRHASAGAAGHRHFEGPRRQNRSGRAD